ncbi:hypothetical protein QUF84_21655 [Fictibacillus enclensis]|uniref:Uncharacterized protein n=1 Tax=Fictibacillus solisalsi TaxID=459525 RepID=A0A1G9XL38_9BACL|nr:MULTISPECIES: hypothetical protein [Fictibacillus]MDM5200445.1 hypothetical protein [Fictibacillus enclensis]MDM5339804.1 hypothetical protein [Fictibacillus enclensis]WHY71340.1 hypothetical protein QNH15_20360 [Fictibacillus enclensis]SDM96915.1 hypothetical protein SAMN04488137_2840 [Fictibacillus solisalsi]
MNSGNWYVKKRSAYKTWKERLDREMTFQQSLIYGIPTIVMIGFIFLK